MFWISFGYYEMYHILRFEFWEKMKPFGFGTIFGLYGGTFVCLPQERIIPCSGCLKPCNPIRNYNLPSDLDLIMFIITICSLLFGAFLASFPHSVSSLDEDNTSFYRNICDEVLGWG